MTKPSRPLKAAEKAASEPIATKLDVAKSASVGVSDSDEDDEDDEGLVMDVILDDDEDETAEMLVEPAPPVKSALKAKVAKAAVPAVPKMTRIILERSPHIPPTGLFVNGNDKSYMIRPGEPVDVPPTVIDILNNAIQSLPVTNAEGQVVGWQDGRKYPYTVVS